MNKHSGWSKKKKGAHFKPSWTNLTLTVKEGGLVDQAQPGGCNDTQIEIAMVTGLWRKLHGLQGG